MGDEAKLPQKFAPYQLWPRKRSVAVTQPPMTECPATPVMELCYSSDDDELNSTIIAMPESTSGREAAEPAMYLEPPTVSEPTTTALPAPSNETVAGPIDAGSYALLMAQMQSIGAQLTTTLEELRLCREENAALRRENELLYTGTRSVLELQTAAKATIQQSTGHSGNRETAQKRQQRLRRRERERQQQQQRKKKQQQQQQ
uniref:Uncharacterized protein n=1 Tax=Anopheles stephensi TaxID=30069 RepID=A0A182YRC3_ANOST